MRIALLTHHATTSTNLGLAASAPPGTRCVPLEPEQAANFLAAGDAVVGRLDVRRTLDGIEDGLTHLDLLETRGLTVRNRSLTLRLAHDKRATSGALAAASLPHPRTLALFDADHASDPPLPFPFVLKPRFGSWGRDVVLVSSDAAYRHALAILRRRAWFAATGAVVQELVPPRGHDIRVVVACGEVIGAIKRVARHGEWRTNVALGAARVPVDPSPAACELAVAAAAAIDGDLVGVDLLPLGPGRYVVLEINGAVDFSPEYDPGGDVYATAMHALVRGLRCRQPLAPAAADANDRCW